MERQSVAIGPPDPDEVDRRLIQIDEECSRLLRELEHDNQITGNELR